MRRVTRAHEERRYAPQADFETRTQAASASSAQAREPEDMTLRDIRRELTDTQNKLAEAVKERLKLELGEGAEERRRNRHKAEIWHLIHRAIGHPGKKITDQAVMACKFHPSIEASMEEWYQRLPPKE